MVNKIYIDTNIFIDLMDSTRPSYEGSFSFVKSSVAEGKTLYINSDTVTNAFYILNRTHLTQTLIVMMQKIVSLFIVVPIENEEVMTALALCLDEATPFKDYEDALQYVCAKKVKADLIVTNDKGFVALDIELLSTKK